MFTKASLRLTAWYVAILMALSLTFSAWLYTEGVAEIRTGLNAQLLRPFANLMPRDEVVTYLDQQYNAARLRVFGSLALMNTGVLVAGSFISYFLARRTLKPIENALEAQNRFTADASHELRTPLTTMKTEIEVALRNKSLPSAEARGLLQSNVEEIDRLSKLAEGLLILARTGDKPLLEPVAADVVAHKAIKRFTHSAEARHITVATQIVPLKAQADASNVDTILGILLDNAIKYSPKKTTVTVALALHEGKTCLTVHNQGTPIAPTDLPHIFERFYRADTSRTSGKAAGHGLGLSIAQKLAVNMGGTVAARSTAADGTTFTLRLPPA